MLQPYPAGTPAEATLRGTLNIGIICYASVGGSGIVATELGKALASRGHQVHLISTDTPFRLGEYEAGLAFHRVETPSYPLFREPQYVLGLANKAVQVAREFGLDVIHAHYAIPHATAGYLTRQILATSPGTRIPKVVTTLHGTDITLLGSDPSWSEIVSFSIKQSDGVTAVSEYLKAATRAELCTECDIRVIPNFLDCAVHRRLPTEGLRARFCADDDCKLVIHVSNFRPVKRADAVVEVFARIRREVPAKLLLVGDGPELGKVTRLIRALDLTSEVFTLGEQDQVLPLLSVSDLFLLPSVQESFGLAALEAMACEVPVVVSNAGGLPEFVQHGVNGYLHPPEDLDAMAASGIRLLKDATLHRRVAGAARRTVHLRFCSDRIVPMYEAYYEEVLGKPAR